MRRFIVLSAALCLAAVSSVAAAGAPAVTGADFSVSPEAHWIWALLASDAVRNVWIYLLTTGIAAVVGWLKWRGTIRERAMMFLAAGVRETYEEYVRKIKAASADGKLTDDERREAVRQAIERAKQYALAEGVDLLKYVAKETLPALIDSIVRRFKGEAALSIPLPLPDLGPSAPSV